MTERISIEINSGLRRVLIAAAAAALITGAVFAGIWGFANTIATQTDVREVAELGVGLAPSDPQARYSMAGILEKTFDPADIARSLVEYETAVSLSPADFRLWLGLGRARERDGDRDGAERAFRRALELAPNYSRIHWALGNNLVRQGRLDEGFAEIRAAADFDRTFAAPAALAAWQAFDGNIQQMRASLGDSDGINAELAKLLVVEKRYDDAAAVWGSIPVDLRRSDHAETAKFLAGKFLEGAKFRSAMSVAAELPTDADTAPAVGSVTNGGFENEVRTRNAGPFDWKIAEGAYPQISPTNGQKRAGSVSLFLRFTDASNPGLRDISQLIAVEPSRKYRLTFFYRSELKTQAHFVWEVISGISGNRIAATAPLVSNTDWTEAAIDIAAPLDVDGVTLRLVRESCSPPSCSVTGVIWFDEFKLAAGQ